MKKIDLLLSFQDMIPVYRESFEDWTIRVFNREQQDCRNYLSANRRNFYKILFITKGTGLFSIGLSTWQIDQPAIIFIHPNDIISWRNLTPDVVGGFYILYKRDFVEKHDLLKGAMQKYGLFTEKGKHLIQVPADRVEALQRYFQQIHQELTAKGEYNFDAIQAYIQLLLVESMRGANFPAPQTVTDEYHHIHEFFSLLEQQASGIDFRNPIRLRTAKEFASSLAIHPNHLNALLKKHTGENVSAHIKNRLVEEAKVLLVQTDWSLNDIGFSIGFADQSNFHQFFKKTTGETPGEFRAKGRQPQPQPTPLA